MRILLASSEVHPYSKTGGLGDMVGALAKALARAGHQVGVVTPLYWGIRERFPTIKNLELPLDAALGVQRVKGEVWALEPEERLTVYFIDQPGFYQRANLYQRDGIDYPDNDQRFIFFAKAVTHLALHLPWKPQLVHVHDWQAALAALLLRHQGQLPGWEGVPQTCVTIHNLAYQGVFPASQYALMNLPWDYFNPEGVEFYGQLNCLKAGIGYSGILTTVSPHYAREITTSEYGCGLDGLLRYRAGSLVGILNGVDYEEWNTEKNPHLPHAYSVSDLAGKTLNKLALQQELGLRVDAAVPLFGNIGRLVEQKGVDIMLGALEEMLSSGLQFVLLTSGGPPFQEPYEQLARRFPGQVAIRIRFHEGLSHRIEAGCDFYLMPSRFEPCGLNQMYGLRYGTIPIVRATGGLDDTVIDIREDLERADGIKFSEYSARALAKAIRKALALYGEPPLFHRYRQNGMAKDFSWDRTAIEFIATYARLLGLPNS
jgi:starch synthase